MLKLKQMQQQKKLKEQEQQQPKQENGKEEETNTTTTTTTDAAATTNGSAATNGGATTKKSAAGQQQIFSLKRGKGKKQNKTNPAELRVQKDLAEMDSVPGAELDFPDSNNIMSFQVKISPTDGLYAGATFLFEVQVPLNYPYDPPKATCKTLVYHPNIDWEGHVCLNILRADWMPVLSLGSVIFGLMTLFLEPNPDDPLNKEAAQLMIERPSDFARNVKSSLRGGHVLGRNFPKLV
ncbi:NEDD8-conjugating enzyme Ubc12 [Balamuthia mandrillaris]